MEISNETVVNNLGRSSRSSKSKEDSESIEMISTKVDNKWLLKLNNNHFM